MASIRLLSNDGKELILPHAAQNEGELKVVWESEVIAGSPIAVHLDLPENLSSEIVRIVQEEVNVDALIERGVCDSQQDCGLTDENVWGWVPVDDSFYDGGRAVCDATEADACES
jgi:phosphonate transport system substrate-binding protein